MGDRSNPNRLPPANSHRWSRSHNGYTIIDTTEGVDINRYGYENVDGEDNGDLNERIRVLEAELAAERRTLTALGQETPDDKGLPSQTGNSHDLDSPGLDLEATQLLNFKRELYLQDMEGDILDIKLLWKELEEMRHSQMAPAHETASGGSGRGSPCRSYISMVMDEGHGRGRSSWTPENGYNQYQYQHKQKTGKSASRTRASGFIGHPFIQISLACTIVLILIVIIVLTNNIS